MDAREIEGTRNDCCWKHAIVIVLFLAVQWGASLQVLKDDLGVTKLVIMHSFMTSILSLCHGQSSSG